MKKLFALVFAFILALSCTACSSNDSNSDVSPIVGKWHTYVSGLIPVYEFNADGTYVYTANVKNGSYSTETKEHGTYTFDEQTGKLTLISENKTEKVDIKINQCWMMLNDLPFGKVYTGREDYGALNDVLGEWISVLGGDGKLVVNMDGTAKMTIPAGSVSSIYIYNPTYKELIIPEAGVRWKLESTKDGTQLTDVEYNGAMTFVKK